MPVGFQRIVLKRSQEIGSTKVLVHVFKTYSVLVQTFSLADELYKIHTTLFSALLM